MSNSDPINGMLLTHTDMTDSAQFNFSSSSAPYSTPKETPASTPENTPEAATPLTSESLHATLSEHIIKQ